jgi:hypothetical protein
VDVGQQHGASSLATASVILSQSALALALQLVALFAFSPAVGGGGFDLGGTRRRPSARAKRVGLAADVALESRDVFEERGSPVAPLCKHAAAAQPPSRVRGASQGRALFLLKLQKLSCRIERRIDAVAHRPKRRTPP